MKRCDRLNFDTLIIQYNAAIRKVQQVQDLEWAQGGIGDSWRLDSIITSFFGI